MAILIGDRSEKINSLMSRAVSLIKVLVRRWGGTLQSETWERDTVKESDRGGQQMEGWSITDTE